MIGFRACGRLGQMSHRAVEKSPVGWPRWWRSGGPWGTDWPYPRRRVRPALPWDGRGRGGVFDAAVGSIGDFVVNPPNV